jgi:hypothetical protein
MIIVADENWRRLFEFAVLAATELADAGRKSDFVTGRRAS